MPKGCIEEAGMAADATRIAEIAKKPPFCNGCGAGLGEYHALYDGVCATCLKKERDRLRCQLEAAEAATSKEKERRVYWQDLTYAAMNAVDQLLPHAPKTAPFTNEDTFKDDLKQALKYVREIEKRQDIIIEAAVKEAEGRGYAKGLEDYKAKIRELFIEKQPGGVQSNPMIAEIFYDVVAVGNDLIAQSVLAAAQEEPHED
jgi:hypothetical protein